MRSALATTLGFLSDDEYSFEFIELKDGPPNQQYLFTRADVASEKPDEVVLFSGGLDSLGGAIREAVVDKRRIALITHEPSKKLRRRYNKLKGELTKRAAHAPQFFPVTINKKKSLGREPTQRSRSFLYMALGATVAQMLGLARIRFYENGVVSFNLPPSGQVIGARATRTTHPQVLRGFAGILSLVAGRRFDVESPFLWHTKADVVDQIVKAGCDDLIRFSTSCTHTWEITNMHPHCGSCSQCIGRRFAVLAAGVPEADPEEGYKTKLLVDERAESEPRTMLASYVETANDVARMSPLDFFSRFGEASRVLRHVDGSPDSTALKLFELHKKHAQQVTSVVDRAIAAHAREIRERSLPETCLLRLVCGSASAAAGDGTWAAPAPAIEPPTAASLGRNVFRKKGQRAWEVRFAGGRDFVVTRTKGASYLHILLSNPRVPMPATKLASMVALAPEEYMLGSAGEDSDREAISAYKARCQDLQEDLEEARRNNDEARQALIEGELAKLAAQIKRDQGLGGRLRKEADDRERVRKAVGIAIKRAVQEIAREDKGLAAHLRSPTLKCGLNPCYDPRDSDQVEWDT